MKYLIVISFYLVFVSCKVNWDNFLPNKNNNISNTNSNTIINPNFLATIQSGDLLFRASNDLVSSFFKSINQRFQEFSHVGIAIKENNELYVLHVLKNDENPQKAMRKDHISSFWSNKDNMSFGYAKLNLETHQINQFIKVADSINKLPIVFDDELNLATTQKLYCTEYVANSLKIATENKITIPITVVNNKSGYTPDNFYNNNICKSIRIFEKTDNNIFLNN